MICTIFHASIYKTLADIPLTDLIVVSANKNYLTSNDEEGSRLSCAYTQQQDQSQNRLSWLKNGVIVAAAISTTLTLNTRDVKAQFVYTYGTYTCKTAAITNVCQYEQSLHIAEKGCYRHTHAGNNVTFV